MILYTTQISEKELKLAVLIDADNTSSENLLDLLAEITKIGTPVAKRIYGDWTKPNLKSWKEVLNTNAILPIQQFAYTTGKNATDSAMIIDAMDLLHAQKYDGFCLVSSDSDFTRLATRIREEGTKVFGFGRRNTPQAFIAACDEFKFLEVIRRERESNPVSTTIQQEQVLETQVSKVRVENKEINEVESLFNNEESEDLIDSSQEASQIIEKAIQATADEDGWTLLSKVGSYLIKQLPQFDSRNYGFPKLSDLVKSLDNIEMKIVPNPQNPVSGIYYIRLK